MFYTTCLTIPTKQELFVKTSKLKSKSIKKRTKSEILKWAEKNKTHYVASMLAMEPTGTYDSSKPNRRS